MQKDEAVNVLGESLQPCGEKPLTGYFRDAYCNTCKQDTGSHTVCVQVTREFLDYSLSQGNDLVTPLPEYGFPGLQPGDAWCLCAGRWYQAWEEGVAPRVFLSRSHQKALEIIPLEVLRKHAADLN